MFLLLDISEIDDFSQSLLFMEIYIIQPSAPRILEADEKWTDIRFHI